MSDRRRFKGVRAHGSFFRRIAGGEIGFINERIAHGVLVSITR